MTGLEEGKPDRRLESWKEIATFCGRDEKTVRRWEKELGLPVHRLPGHSKGRVYAFAHELSEWSNRPRASKLEVPADAVLAISEPLPPVVISHAPAPQPTAKRTGRFRALYLTLAIAVLLIVAMVLAKSFSLHDRRLSLASIQAAGTTTATHHANPEAERLYLEGRYYWNKRTAAGLNRAIDDFTQAIVLDPQDARPYAGLADSYNLIREYTSMPEEEAFSRAESAARKAVELDPNLAEAHRALAFPSFWWKHDVFTADREFKRAIAINPNDGTAHLWYANFLSSIGENDEAVAQIDRAQELDPTSSSVRADKGLLLYSAGKKDDAIQLLKQMKKNEPNFVSPHRYLSEIYFLEGDYPEHMAEAREAARLANKPDEMRIVEAEKRGFARHGERGLLEEMFAEQKQQYDQQKTTAFALAQTLAKLGDHSQALKYLMISRKRRESELSSLRTDIALRGLHNEPLYQQLVAEVGLPSLK